MPIPIITTVAGNGRELLGVGGPATSVAIGFVSGGIFDSSGNLYISALQDNEVLKVSPSGILTVAVGTGEGNYSGDGGSALNATLSQPGPLAVDSAGDLFISDFKNYVVREVNPAGIINTVGAFQAGGFAGDANGNMYASEIGGDVVHEITPGGVVMTIADTYHDAGYSGDGGPAKAALLGDVEGLAIDGTGNLYIADNGNARIREVINGIISTVAGNGMFGTYGEGDGGPAIDAPIVANQVAVGQDGSIYINGNNSISKIDPQGIINTIAGDGNFGATMFQFPPGSLAIDADMEGAGLPALLPNGDFYVACCESNIDKVSAADGTIQVFVRGYDFTGFGEDLAVPIERQVPDALETPARLANFHGGQTRQHHRVPQRFRQ